MGSSPEGLAQAWGRGSSLRNTTFILLCQGSRESHSPSSTSTGSRSRSQASLLQVTMTLAHLHPLIHLTALLQRFSETSSGPMMGTWILAAQASREHPSQTPHRHRVTRRISVGLFLGSVTLCLESTFSKLAICLEPVSWYSSCFLTFLKEQPWSSPPYSHPSRFPFWLVNFLGLTVLPRRVFLPLLSISEGELPGGGW